MFRKLAILSSAALVKYPFEVLVGKSPTVVWTVCENSGRAKTPTQLAERTPYVPFASRFAGSVSLKQTPNQFLPFVAVCDVPTGDVASIRPSRRTPAMTYVHLFGASFETEMNIGRNRLLLLFARLDTWLMAKSAAFVRATISSDRFAPLITFQR